MLHKAPADGNESDGKARETSTHSPQDDHTAEGDIQDEGATTPKARMHPSRINQHKSHQGEPRREHSALSTAAQHKASRIEMDTTAHKTQQTLRDPARKAYSQSSLHTHKSDPLRRRKRHGVHGKGQDNAGGKERKGQPNMKLRMDVMLEKIKRDFA